MSQKQITKAWRLWAIQVNANYHDGNMSPAEAEQAAGPEPVKFEVQTIEEDEHCQETIDSFLMDVRGM